MKIIQKDQGIINLLIKKTPNEDGFRNEVFFFGGGGRGEPTLRFELRASHLVDRSCTT
jgi:hypothetical protein